MSEQYDGDPLADLVTMPCRMYQGAMELWATWLSGILTPLGLSYGSCSGTHTSDKKLEFKGEKDVPVTLKFRIRNSYLRTTKYYVGITDALKHGDTNLSDDVLTVDPPEFEFGALQSRTVDVTVKFDKDFEVGKSYVAEIKTMAVVRTCDVTATRTK